MKELRLITHVLNTRQRMCVSYDLTYKQSHSLNPCRVLYEFQVVLNEYFICLGLISSRLLFYHWANALWTQDMNWMWVLISVQLHIHNRLSLILSYLPSCTTLSLFMNNNIDHPRLGLKWSSIVNQTENAVSVCYNVAFNKAVWTWKRCCNIHCANTIKE